MSEHDNGETGRAGAAQTGHGSGASPSGDPEAGGFAVAGTAVPSAPSHQGSSPAQGSGPTANVGGPSFAPTGSAPSRPAMGTQPWQAGPAIPAGTVPGAMPGYQPYVGAPGGYPGGAQAVGDMAGSAWQQQVPPGMYAPPAGYYHATPQQAAYHAQAYGGQAQFHPEYATMPPHYAPAADGTMAGGIAQPAAEAAGGRAGRGQAGIAGLMEEINNGGTGLNSLGKMLNLDDSEFWKGALVGAAAVLLLTNESVQNALFKGGAKAKEAVKSGAEKLKEAASGAAD